MATEAEKPEDVAISEVGDCNSLLPGIVGNSTRTEDLEVAQNFKEGTVNHNNEVKVGNSESGRFLESCSLASKASGEISKDDTDSKDEPKLTMIKTQEDQSNETVKTTCDIAKYDEIDASSKQVSKEMSVDDARDNVGHVNSTSLSKTDSDDEIGKVLSHDLNLPEGLNESRDDAVMNEMKQNSAAPFDSKQDPIIECVQSGDITPHGHVTLSEGRKEEEICPNQSTAEDTAVISIQKDDAEGHKSGEDSDIKSKEEESVVSNMEVEAHNKEEVMSHHLATPNKYIMDEPKQSNFQEEHCEKGEVETEIEETGLQKSEAEESCSPDITSNDLLSQTTVKAKDSQKQKNDVNATEPEIQEKDLSAKIEGVDSKNEKDPEQFEKDKPNVEHDDTKEVPPETKQGDLDFQINDADQNTDETPIIQRVEACDVNEIKEVDCTAKDHIAITTGEIPGNGSSKEDAGVQNPEEVNEELQTNRDDHNKNNEDATIEDLPTVSTKTENEVTEGEERADADMDKPTTEKDGFPDYFTPVIKEKAILHDNGEDKVTGELERVDEDNTGESIIEEDVGPEHFRTVTEEKDKVQVTEESESVDADKGTEETIIEKDVPDHSRTIIDREAINHDDEKHKVVAGTNVVCSDMDRGNSIIEKDTRAENSTTTITDEETIGHDHKEDKVTEGLGISTDEDIQESNVAGDAVLDQPTIENANEPTTCAHDNKAIEGSEKSDAESAIIEDVPHHSIPIIGEDPMKQQEQKVREVEIVIADKEIGETIIEGNVLDYSTTMIEKEPIFHDEVKVIEKLEIDDADKTTGECFIEGVVPDNSTTITSINEEPTKDFHEKDEIVDGLETVGTGKDIKEQVRENDVLDHFTVITEEKSINNGHEEDKITAGFAIANDKGISDPVIEEDAIRDQSTTTIGEEPITECQQKEKATEDSEIVDPNKHIEDPIIEENVALDHVPTTLLENPIGDVHEDDKVIGKAIIEDIVMEYPTNTIVEEPLKDGLEENKGIEELNIVGADKDTNDPLIVEDDKCEVTATSRENSIKDDHEEDKVKEGLEIVGTDKENSDFAIKDVVFPDYSSTIIVEEPIRKDQAEEKVIDKEKIVEADNDISDQVKEEEVVHNSITTIMEEQTKDDHEEDEASEGLEIVRTNKDTEEPVIEQNSVSHYSTSTIGEQTMNDGHEKDKGIEILEIDGADQTTPTGKEPIEDDHEETMVTETCKSASAHNDIDEHIVEKDVPHHFTTTISEENVIEGLEMNDANKNSGETIIEKNVALNDSTRTTEQEPTKNGEGENQVIQMLEISNTDKNIGDPILEYVPEHSTTTTREEPVKEGQEENKVTEQIQILGVDKEIGGAIVEDNVSPNRATSVIGEEASHDDHETIDGLQAEGTEKDNEEAITKEDLAQEHSTTTQEEPIEDDHEKNKISGTNQVAAQGESTEKMDEDEMVIEHKKSTGEETNEKISRDYEVSTKGVIGEAHNVPVAQIMKDGSLTELSTVSDRKEATNTNSQEEEMESKKYEGKQVKELDSMETTYQTPASAQKVETKTPSDENGQDKNQHVDSVTDASMGETVEKVSEDLTDTSNGLSFEELDTLDGASSLVPDVSEEKLNNEILQKEGTEDNPTSLADETKKASLHDAESECRETTKPFEGVDRDISINDNENNTSQKEQGSIKNLEESFKEETTDTKLTNHLRDHAIQNEEVMVSFGNTSEEQNFKPIMNERTECSNVGNLNKHADDSSTAHQLLENHAKDMSDIVPENKVHEKDTDSPKKEEQIVELFEKSNKPEIPVPWQEKTIDGERITIEQSELEIMKLERIDESDSMEGLGRNDLMDDSQEVSTIKEEYSSKIFDTETVEDKKTGEDDAVHDQSTLPCSYETANRSFNEEKEQTRVELEPELEDDYHIHTIATEQWPTGKNQNEEVHEELEHTEKETIQDIIVKDHATNADEVIVHENSPKDNKVSKTPDAKVAPKESGIISTEEATDSTSETEILHSKEVEEEDPKKSIDAFGTTKAALEEITKMETHDNINYSSTESSLSEEQVMVEIPEKKENNNNETIFATPRTEKLSLHETETEGGELVDATKLASRKILDDNTTEDTVATENSKVVAQEKSDIPVEASSIVLQSVNNDTVTDPVKETTASKPSSDDIIERIPRELSDVVSSNEEIRKIGTQVMEAPSVEQTKREMNMRKEQDIKHDADHEMVNENSEPKILNPDSEPETHISEQKDGDMILERGDITEVDKFREDSKSETSEPNLKENQPKSDDNSKDLDTIDTRVDPKTDILKQEEDQIKKPDQILEENKKETTKVDENVLEVHTTDQSEEIDEPCNTTKNFTITKKNLDATDLCEEFKEPTEKADHDQSHKVLPETEITEVVNDREIIKDQGDVFAEDSTVGQSIKEYEQEDDTLDKAGSKVENKDQNSDMHDVNHLMKDTTANEEVFCVVERPEGDNIEKQNIEEEKARGVEVLEDKTRDKEVKDTDFTSSEGVTNATYCTEKPDAITSVKELNQSVDASCDTEASTGEIFKQEEVSDATSENLGVATGSELDIPKTDQKTDTCIKGSNTERMNLGNTSDLISDVQTTKHVNIDEESVMVGNDVKANIENDIIIKNTEESFEVDQKNAESDISKEMASAELSENCKVDSDFVPDEHNESNAEGHDTTSVKDQTAEEIIQEKKAEENIMEVKRESTDDRKSKSNEADEDTTIDELVIGKPVEEESGLVPDEKIHETAPEPSGNKGTTQSDGTDPEQLVEVKEPLNSIFGTTSSTENLHIEKELPNDNRDVLSSQVEMQEKEGNSNQDETEGMVMDKIEKKENSLPTNKSEEDTEQKAPVEEMTNEAVKKINDLNTQEENSATEEGEAQVVKQSDTSKHFETLDQTSDVSAEENIIVEASPTEKSASSMEAPSPPVGVTQKSCQTATTEDGKYGESKENVLEVKKAGEEEKRIHSLDEKDDDVVSKSPEAGGSLHDLLQRSRETTGQTVDQSGEEGNSPHNKKEAENKDEPVAETKDGDKIYEHEDAEDGEGEDGDEHKKDDSGSDAPVMVEASRDIDVKPTPKKSHNILSGVSSKVKHSISKVKKAITGKSSHQKQSSPK